MRVTLLTAEDQAILELESPTVVGHTCKVIQLGRDAPDLDSLRASVARRIVSTPELTRRIARTARGWAWVTAEQFDVADHVVAADAVEGDGLRELVARIFAERLDRSRPLWRIDLVPVSGDGAAVIWRVHHALADGTTTMRLARALLWDAQPAEPAQPTVAARSDDDARRRGHLVGFIGREFARTRERSPFDGRIGTHREVAFAATRLDDLRRAGKTLCGATLNDAVLTAVTGGVRAWILRHHGHLGTLRVKVPVSLHHEADDAANRDSFFTVGLPLHEPDPVARLRAAQAATSVRKAEDDAETMDALIRRLADVSPALDRLCSRIQRSPRSFAVNVSNVVGPRRPVSLLGSTVQALYSIGEIGERHALRVAVVSAGGMLFFGFCADPAIVDGVQTMADGTESECRALAAAAAG